MSRFTSSCNKIIRAFAVAAVAWTAGGSGAGQGILSPPWATGLSALQTRVVIVEDKQAVQTFVPNAGVVAAMFNRALTELTQKTTVREAWLSLVSTQDVLGLKVYSMPGPLAGTRPAVVEAVVRSLFTAGVPATNIVIWDKNFSDLKAAGFVELARRLGVGVAGAADAGYDPNTFYEKPFIGFLIFSDLEFGRTSEGKGRKSYVSNLLTHRLTKLINITPMLNHNTAGVSGNLFGLAMGSVDNTLRFETDFARLSEAVPEIYALPELCDHVVLNVVDALLCQYEGEFQSMLQYASVLNQIRVSKDPVALDVLSLREINRQRVAASMPVRTNSMDLFFNAGLMELGTCDGSQISIEKLP